MTHLTFEQLSELADSREPKVDSREHLASCDQCRATLERVERLLQATQALPREIAPSPEVWAQLRSRVSQPPRHAARTSRTWHPRWFAAAAAVVIMVGGALFLPPSVGKGKGKGAPLSPVPAASLHSPVVLSVEGNYRATVDELRRTLDQQRGQLSPTTVRVLERSLATIDTAIAEARAALASDPSNQVLVHILSAHFERKVELLQRATELTSS